MSRHDSTSVGFSLLLFALIAIAIGFIGQEVFCQQLPVCDGTRLSGGTANCPAPFGSCDFVGVPCEGDAQVQLRANYPKGTLTSSSQTSKVEQALYACLQMAKCKRNPQTGKCFAERDENGAISYGQGHGYVSCVIPG